ncbi:hypothetical protein [Candidatus Nitrospira salsa]
MQRKIIFLLGLNFLILLMLFPCVSQAEEGVKSTSPLGGGALAVQPTLAEIPPSANMDWVDVCVDRSLHLNGDIQSFKTGGFGQWSVGPSVSTQLIIYDFGKKKAGVNQALGVGASFRFYRPITIKDANGNPMDFLSTPSAPQAVTIPFTEDEYEVKQDRLAALENKTSPSAQDLLDIASLTTALTSYEDAIKKIEKSRVYISQIKQECRQTSFGRDTNGYLSAPMFSITPTLFASEPIDQNDVAIQPALLFGFFEDILNIGVGFNLTGPAGQKGNVFLLMGIGAGFDF